MLIAEARLVKNTEETYVRILDVSKRLYEVEMRGSLFCPTKGCPAKLSYVNSERAHFRTWKYHSHHEACVYHYEKRWVERDFTFPDVTVGFEFNRRQKALTKAYQAMRYPTELLSQKNMNGTSVTVQSSRLLKRKSVTGFQTTLFDDETWQGLKRKRPPLRRKFVSKINASDIGQHKLVMGYVQKVDLIEDVGRITLLESEKEIDVVFEDAFIAEAKNYSYLNKFRVIQHFVEQNEDTAFAGIGEVRFNRVTDRFELQIFFGKDFRMEDMDLLELSAEMALDT